MLFSIFSFSGIQKYNSFCRQFITDLIGSCKVLLFSCCLTLCDQCFNLIIQYFFLLVNNKSQYISKFYKQVIKCF